MKSSLKISGLHEMLTNFLIVTQPSLTVYDRSLSYSAGLTMIISYDDFAVLFMQRVIFIDKF